MVYALNYQRPAYVSSIKSSSSQASLDSRNVVLPGGIPEALSFSKIISGATCPPCTLRDFMNYLLYVEFSAENLQFYLWLKDYVKRFNALQDSEKALAKPIELARQDSIALAVTKEKSQAAFPAAPAHNKYIKIADTNRPVNPFADDFGDEKEGGMRSGASSFDSMGSADYRTAAATAYDSADVKFQPFTIQPYREEVSRIIAIYVSNGAPRQLNLSSKERAELLRNLAITTHPSAFLPVLQTVEWTLKHQAHPNFIRWTIGNANRPRQVFAHSLGFSFVLLGLAIMAPLAASRFSRAWRAFGALPILFGFCMILAAWKGVCVILYGKHHRHLRPWELFCDNDEAALQVELKRDYWDAYATKLLSYEDQPWVVQYQKRSTIRKIFDLEIWIQEPALRRIQDTIFVQSLLTAAVLTAVLVGGFCAIPPGNRF